MTPTLPNITYHPSEALLLDHYHGRLTDGPELLVSAHIEMCAHCRESLRLFPAIGGALLQEIEGIQLSADALELAMARIERPFDAETRETAEPVRASSPAEGAFLDGYDMPETIRRRAPSRYWAAPKVWVAKIRPEHPLRNLAERRARTYLLGVAPNMVMPLHDHGGTEMTLVLQGGFSDADGTYDVGDFIEKSPGEVHAPVSDAQEGCVSLITHTEPIRPQTILGILLKPFARI
jgi:putative transcriptional regulator